MRKHYFSSVKMLSAGVGALLLVYSALIAVVMSYASITIDFRQTIKQQESEVATLEQAYLARVQALTAASHTHAGYETPVARRYVNEASATALR